MSERCGRCGGLLAPDAEWCGQCYAPVGSVAAEPAPADPEARPAAGSEPGWDCPSCGRTNPLEADLCASCGTSFGRLLEDPEPAPAVEPARARSLSFLFPGLGHVAAKRAADGLVRMVTFAWLLGALLALVLARREGGLGRATIFVVLYGVAAAALYAVTPVDAERVASGESPVLSTRVVGIGLGVVLLLTIVLPFVLR